MAVDHALDYYRGDTRGAADSSLPAIGLHVAGARRLPHIQHPLNHILRFHKQVPPQLPGKGMALGVLFLSGRAYSDQLSLRTKLPISDFDLRCKACFSPGWNRWNWLVFVLARAMAVAREHYEPVRHGKAR